MQIEINNFGPIAKFEFDLTKDLNLIFGKNNIGKSYAISALYIIMKHLISQSEFFTLRFGHSIDAEQIERYIFYTQGELRPEYMTIINRKLDLFRKDAKLSEVNITEEIQDLLVIVINQYLSDKLTKSFNSSFSSINDLTNQYSKQSPRILISNEYINIELVLTENRVLIDKVVLQKQVFVKRAKKARVAYSTDSYTRIYVTSQMMRNTQKTKEADRIKSTSNIYYMLVGRAENMYRTFSVEIGRIFQSVYFLPASRSGLYQALSTFSAVIAELSKSRNFVTSSSIELPAISEPVSDYFLGLSNIGSAASSGSVSDIAKKIEEEILGGVVSFNKETRKMIFVQNNVGSQWDLSTTSSMISEIAPIVAYLKFIVQEEPSYYRYTNRNRIDAPLPYNLIFIEEPEAHLHPEIQVKLMVFFTLLIKHRVKIIMTTHSNYMFNKLNNLILSDAVNFQTVGSYLMRKGPDGSIADSLTMQAVEYGIEDENFSDVAEQLYNERMYLFNKNNA